MKKKKHRKQEKEDLESNPLVSDYSTSDNIFSFARMSLQALGSKAVVTEVFYAYFLLVDVTLAAIAILLEELKKEYGYEPHPITLAVLIGIAYTLVVSTLFTDTVSVNHIKMAEEFLPVEAKEGVHDSSRVARCTTNTFTYLNYAQFIPASMIWCLGDVLAIYKFFEADQGNELTTKQQIALTSILTYFFGSTYVYAQAYLGSRLQNLPSKIAIGTMLLSAFGVAEFAILKCAFEGNLDSDIMTVLKAGLGGVSNILGVIALWMFFSGQVKNQVADLANRFLCRERTLANIAKEPAASLELTFLITTNCIMKAASAGFMSTRAAARLFDIDNASTAMLSILGGAAAWTGYNTFISRSSSVKEWLLNKEFDLLTPNDFKEVRVDLLSNVASGALALLRGGSVAWLLYHSLSFTDLLPNTLITTIITLPIALHHFYVLYQKDLKEAALAHYQLQHNKVTLDVSEMQPAQIFDEIQNQNVSKHVKRVAKFTNVLARFNKNILGLFVFLFTIRDILADNQLNVPLGFKDIIAWSVLMGASISETEIKSYEDEISKTIAFYWAKIVIGPATLHANSIVSFFFYPPEKYDKERLIRAYRPALA